MLDRAPQLVPVDFDPFADAASAPLPLTPPQSEVWVECQMGRDASCAFNQCFVFHLRGPTSAASLRNALNQTIARHEALRTTFDKEGGEQRIRDEVAATIPLEDLAALDADERAAAIERLIDRETTEPFDLEHGPLLRATLIREAADRHRLVVTAHHIVCDGWSSAVLFSDLAAAYRADRFGLAAQLPAPMSYRAYVAQEASRADGAVDDAYWLKQLDAATALDLPVDRKRQSERTRVGSRETLRVEADLYRRVKAVGASCGATLYHTLLAAFETLMFRLSSQTDLVLGMPIARQSELENQHLVAHCVATLPLRCHIDPDESFTQFVRRVRASVLAALAHPNATFGSLLPKLSIERDTARPPLIAAAFNIDRMGAPFDFGDVALERVETPKRFVTFDLNVNAVDSGSDVLIECDYNSHLFDGETIRRWLGHLRTLLASIARAPESTLGRIDILEPEERRRLLAGPSIAAPPQHAGETLHGRFESQVRLTPDAEAVTAGATRLSYAALNAAANRVAHGLLSLGVERGSIVGLSVGRDADVAIGILGILKAGAGYLPLDPDYPAERLAFMVEDAQAKVVVGRGSPAAGVALGSARWLDLDRTASFPATDPAAGAQAADLAYVIYTSGSTGKPKGVLVSHAHVARLFSATAAWFSFTAADVWTLFHSYAFDFSVWELWGALLHGGRLVVAPYWVSRDPAAFRRLLLEERVSVLNQTPSAFRQLIQADQAAAAGAYGLRLVIFGGEALELQALKPWFARYGDARPQLVNMYGITETTVHVSYRPLTAADVAAGRGSVIGRPIPDLFIRLLDARGEPSPVGVPGEIWVGGAGVANGYLKRPALTAERFLADPLDGSGRGRLYRAGDLARRLADGDLEFLGRLDDQVKIRGFRIELGEIEAALAACAGIADAAVIARQDSPGEARLVAYVVGPEGAPAPSAATLRAALAATLPSHMIPAHFIPLKALPLNANGKLDRKALPKPEEAEEAPASDLTPPRSQTEEAVAAIWRQVLKTAAVDCAEDFFRIGGHSLLATQVASRLRDVFQIELSVAALFHHRSVQSLAAHVDALLRDQRRAAPMPQIQPRSSSGPERLSASQERMWVIHEFAPDNRAYNIPLALELTGALDADAMAQAIDALRRRHEALRTTYALDGAFPAQTVEPWSSQPLETIDLGGFGDRAFAEAKQQAAIDAARPFDLAGDPMMRSALYRLGADHHLLVLTVHHIAADDWAFGLITRDLATAYNNIREGRPDGLEAPALSYRDYSAWQRRWLETESDRQLSYWRERLAGLAPLELPTDQPRPDVFGFEGALYERPFPEELHARLETAGRREGATLFMTTLAAYVALLHRISGQDDIAVAVPISNRTQTASEHIVGTFVNTLAIRVDLGGAPSLRDVLRRVRAAALDAYSHQDAPFEKLVEDLARSRDPSRPPLTQVMFNLLNAPVHGMRLHGLNCKAHPVDLLAAQFEIGFNIDLTLARALLVEYNTELFHESTIARYVDQYRRILEYMTADDLDVRVQDLQLLSADEEEQAVRRWNLTDASYPAEVPFTRLFEETARRHPDDVAVVFEDAQLSYAELNAKANRLARRLIENGAGRGTMAALCLHRSLDLVVALLAIQKSGAAYVPLDPGFPAERLSYMLADSGASLLLTAGDAAEGVETPAQTRVLDIGWLALDGTSADDLDVAPGPEDPVYVIYTSGSTGRPKGVAVPHRALANFLRSMQREPGLSRADTFVAVTTISFDIAGLELYLPLMVGARVALASRDTASDGLELARLLASSGATILQATPSTWRMLLEEGWAGDTGLRALCGGEALPSDLAEALLPRVKALWNLYGPTETTIWSTAERITSSDSLTIGRPIANTQIYIVDKAGQPVATEVAGEIWIGGDGVALGYHQRPELTAERFLTDPFCSRAGARLYRTGDLGRRLPDGRLQHLGRMDNQVKVRGFRIELGEIEAALNAHPAVRQSVVVTRAARPGDIRIIAYVVAAEGETLTVSDARRHLRSSLPDYMIPSFVMTLEALPLTANGKIDRAVLPDPFQTAAEEAALSEPPAPGMEQIVADIWRDALRVHSISAGDNFFDLGGHSLLAVRVAVALQKKIGWRMDPRLLFFQTLRHVAAQAAAATAPPSAERFA